MPLPTARFWNKVPFVRLLVALISGILFQWHWQFSVQFLFIGFTIAATIAIAYFFVPVKTKYRFNFLNGITNNILIALVGALLVWFHDIRNNQNWIGYNYKDSSYVVVTIEEPLVEKTNSFKAVASIGGTYTLNNFTRQTGKLIIYFKKDSSIKRLSYGSQIVFSKPLQEIKNAGNPGSFDYKRYSLFQGITHQVYLSSKDFETLTVTNKNSFQNFIFQCRSWVVATLQKLIEGEKEQGLAEALLIGYKDDLDKN